MARVAEVALTALLALHAAAPCARAALGRPAVKDAEQRLSDLGYWTGPVDGTWDAASRAALVAFQKLEGRKPTGVLDVAELRSLHAATPPRPLEGGAAHIEIDVARQVLLVVDGDGACRHVLPVSTGSGRWFTAKGYGRTRAVTPRGRLQIYRKLTGWQKSPLGEMYYPMFIVGGIAIHGHPSVPARPASHGCIRIPMFAARELSAMIPAGTTVLVHDAGSFDNGPLLK